VPRLVVDATHLTGQKMCRKKRKKSETVKSGCSRSEGGGEGREKDKKDGGGGNF